MGREETQNLAISKIDKAKFLILELITGYGKTKVAIDTVNHVCSKYPSQSLSILILVARKVHKQTWLDEIDKWGGINTTNITFECYESLRKHAKETFDIIIADECHHLSEKRLGILKSLTINKAFIGLSATIKRDMRKYFSEVYKAEFIRCGLKEAVNEDILPEPTVYLMPLKLDNTQYNYKTKRFNRDVITTQKGYYDIQSSLIDWYKRKYMSTRNERIKNIWLSTAGKRLKWLAEQKESIILSLLDHLHSCKTLTFCSSIAQTERLGRYNITSKNKDSINNLVKFNDNKIKHITACDILNEGVNLTNCRVGIFCNLSSSEIVTKQRTGRILRHKSPIIILPYFRQTREEEIINTILQEYSQSSIQIINSFNEIKL